MVCKNPYMVDATMPAPCGKCTPCLVARKSKWTNRILLESLQHETSSFVTLTYSDDMLPFTNSETGEQLSIPTLDHKHVQKFLKKIRKAVDTPLRYYVAGEYGSDYRPHYHIALFGYEPCRRGKTNTHNLRQGRSCCPPCDALYKAWTDSKSKEHYGTIDNGDIQKASAGYIAGYVTKKMFRKDEDINDAEKEYREQKNRLLNGRYPEYQRSSLKPGIGALDLQAIADALHSEYGANMLNDYGDVPQHLHYKGKKLYLDRYLRTKIRDLADLGELFNPETGEIYGLPQEIQKQDYQEKMQILLEDFKHDPQARGQTFQEWLVLKDKAKILKIEKRHNMKGKRHES